MTDLCVDGATVTDPIAAPVITAVLDAVLEFYDATAGVVAPCSAGIIAGTQVQVDRGMDWAAACQGFLSVRLVDVYPSKQFPAQFQEPVRDMDNMSYAVSVEVGVWRAAPLAEEGADGATLPSLDEEKAAAALASLDSAMVRHSVLDWARTQDIGIVLGMFSPWGPEGGVVGGATSFIVQVV